MQKNNQRVIFLIVLVFVSFLTFTELLFKPIVFFGGVYLISLINLYRYNLLDQLSFIGISIALFLGTYVLKSLNETIKLICFISSMSILVILNLMVFNHNLEEEK